MRLPSNYTYEFNAAWPYSIEHQLKITVVDCVNYKHRLK